MIISDVFSRIYWEQYISIEKEFYNTLQYVSLSEDNYNTYSNAYAKIILQIGSEVDILLNYYCRTLDNTFRGKKIHEYKKIILRHNKYFAKQLIQCRICDISLQPWIDWDRSDKQPFWWTTYNKIKHDRMGTGEINGETKEFYKFANLKNALYALSALYQILIYSYYELATRENKTIITPLPGSRIFRLTGNMWDNINFYGDYAFYINNDGNLIMEFGMPYN